MPDGPAKNSENGDLQVLIVGGGPVGLGLAIELGHRNIRCMLIDQRDGTISVPKMGLVNTRSMEFCRRWGIAEDVKEAGYPPDYPGDVIYVTSMTGYELARIAIPSPASRGQLPHTPEGKIRCSQLFFDPLLRDHAKTLPAVTLRYRTRLTRLAQDSQGVTAYVTDLDSGAEDMITAQYLVGCDGIDSTVREQLGIGLQGETVSDTHLTAFFRSPDYLKIHDKGRAVHSWLIGPDGMWGHINAVNGRDLWRLELNGLEPDVDVEALDVEGTLRRAVGKDFDHETLAVMPWGCRWMVADRYREGRILLAGDAVHQNTPTGGHGMNTGLGDAVDLGWKLAAVLDGWGGDHLLDSYETERRPISARNVKEASDNYQRHLQLPSLDAIDTDTPKGEEQRKKFRKALESVDESRQYVNEGIGLGYRYEPSPIIVPDGTEPPPDEAKTYRQTARPGSRAPHAWIAPGKSTLDLFGDGFVLLRLGTSPPDATPLEQAAAQRSVPFRIVDIADDEIAALYERKLVLVRPDGHVAWRNDSCPADPQSLIDTVRGA